MKTKRSAVSDKRKAYMKAYGKKYRAENKEKCSKCEVEISANGKTGLCLPCVNKIHNPRVLPERYCEECGKKLDRKRNKSGLCKQHQLIKRNKSVKQREASRKVMEKLWEKPGFADEVSERIKTFGWGTDTFRLRMEKDGNWRKQDEIPDFEKYTEIVRDATDKNYQANFYEIPDAKKRSREYHLDHKVSIAYGFENNIPAYIIAHHKNLEVIHHSLNESKHTNNSITIDELLLEIDR